MRILSVILLFNFWTVDVSLARESVTNSSQHGAFPPLSATNPEQTLVNINNLTVWVRDDGFHDWVVLGWNGTFPIETVGFIFSEGMIWGGFVNDGETTDLRVGGSTYMSGNLGGAILTDGFGNVTGAENPDDSSVRPYRVRPDWATADLTKDAAYFFLIPADEVTASQIEEIRNQYETDWNEWPAEKGAPFDDVDYDAVYNPAIDIPGIPGADQTLWIVHNDLDTEQVVSLYGSPPIGLEVQETYWAYSRYNTMSNVVFKRVRIILLLKKRLLTLCTLPSGRMLIWDRIRTIMLAVIRP